MRVLCLHGKGTSGTIFMSQTSTFRQRLDALSPQLNLDFDFVNAPLLSSSAPGIDLFYGGPYYSFFESASQPELEAAHSWLLELLARQGPYDGVMAFSQGCALTATLLIRLQRQQIDAKSSDCPFKFAIFICGGIPADFLQHQGYEVSMAALEHASRARQALQSQASSAAVLQNGSDRWQSVSNKHPSGVEISNTDMLKADDIHGFDCTQIRPEQEIQIPTVHVYGSRDPIMGSGLQLARFCNPDKRRVFDHGGGHEIPRVLKVSEGIADLLKWVVAEAQ